MNFTWPNGELTDALPCPVCDARGPHTVLLRTAGPDAVLVQCDTCTALTFPGQTPPDYAQETPPGLFVQLYAEQNCGLHHMTRLLWQLDPAVHPVDSVLDVGCGFGFPVDAAARVLGWRAVGIDPSFYADEGRAMLGADIRRAYLTAEADLGAPFGLVLGVEMIEHIPDLYPFMAVLRQHMEPGGVLVMTTPDAGAIVPATSEGTLVPMLSVGAHIVLFSAQAMEHYLRRAGFAHVVCQIENQSLVVFASDRPIVFRADAAAAHAAGYATYLNCLLDSAAPGSTLWNGAAGRLLGLTVGHGAIDALLALWTRIASAWRDRFGIDLLRLRLPPALDEAAFRITGPGLVDRLREQAPLNLGAVLYHRTVLERRTPGHTPESVLAFARAATIHAGQTYRALRDYGMVDYDLHNCAWQARLIGLDMLVSLAPELETALLLSLVQPSPGALAGLLDPPRAVAVRRLAPVFNRLVHATAYDEAMSLAPALMDLDIVVDALAALPMVLFHALFCIGVLRLNHLGTASGARAAFDRMRMEALARLDGTDAAIAAHFQVVAEHHLLLVPARRRRTA